MTYQTNEGFGFDRPRGFLFDVDGVITPTAAVHQRAWKLMFDAVLDDPFTDDDYLRYVDGRARKEGIAAVLASRSLHYSEAEIDELATTKNDTFLRILHEEGVVAYPDAVSLIDHLLDIGSRLAVVSSSRNAKTVLDAAGLSDRFDGWVDGIVAAEHGLPGKPAPDVFQLAASMIGLEERDCIVIEDAEAGVRAGAAGSFAAVVGVDRVGNAEALTECGADLVVTDLNDLKYGVILRAD